MFRQVSISRTASEQKCRIIKLSKQLLLQHMLRFLACFGCSSQSRRTHSRQQNTEQVFEQQQQPAKESPLNRKESGMGQSGDTKTLTATTAVTLSREETDQEAEVNSFISELKVLDHTQRKAAEAKFVKKYFRPSCIKYVVDREWALEYSEFLAKTDKKELRKINNNGIINHGRLISGLIVGREYCLISRKAWLFIQKLYGGGPAIEFAKCLPLTELPQFGLSNNFSSCYMNAGLQALFSIPEFAQYFVQGNFMKQKHKTKFSDKLFATCTHQFLCLFKEKASSNKLSLDSLRKMVETSFSRSTQHDCQEFIRFYISRLQDELNPRIKSEKQNPTKQELLDMYYSSHTSIVDTIFYGCLTSQIKCLNCGKLTLTYDPILQLTIEMSANSLQGCLRTYFSSEKLIDFYMCDRCGAKSKATKQFYLERLPLYLMITVKRFQEDQRKVDEKISYPLEFNIQKYCKQAQPSKYSLQSVVIHEGDAMSGHYYILTQRQGKWFSISDQKILPIDINKHLLSEAYILIYKKMF